MKRLLGILCALAAVRAGADTLGDVKAAVGRLTAKQPVHATFTVEAAVKAAGKYANQNMARAVAAEVAHDAAGVTITIPQALLDKAAHEARSGGEGGAEAAIGSLRSSTIVEALDFRDSLLGMLDAAKVSEEKRVAFRGRPARLLVMTLSPRPRKDANSITIGSVKSDERLSLWIGDDNLPIAAERFLKTTAGFLFIKGEHSGRTSYTFAHTPDRLVLARVETSGSSSGMGQKFEESSVQTLTLH